jgi:hypothetical protein
MEIWRQIWSNNPNERVQPRDPPPHRRRGHLSRPGQHHPTRRRRPRRATRLVGRRTPLPRTRRPGSRPGRRHRRHHHGGDPARTRSPHGLIDTPNRGTNLVHHPSGLDRADWAADAGDGPVTRRIEPSARLIDSDMTSFKRTPWIGHPQSSVDKSQQAREVLRSKSLEPEPATVPACADHWAGCVWASIEVRQEVHKSASVSKVI